MLVQSVYPACVIYNKYGGKSGQDDTSKIMHAHQNNISNIIIGLRVAVADVALIKLYILTVKHITVPTNHRHGLRLKNSHSEHHIILIDDVLIGCSCYWLCGV